MQLVITMVFASLFSKLVPHFSLARRLLASSGLVRYLPPEDEELRRLGGVRKEKPKRGGRRDQSSQQNSDAFGDLETFQVPRNIDVELETAKVAVGDIVQLR